MYLPQPTLLSPSEQFIIITIRQLQNHRIRLSRCEHPIVIFIPSVIISLPKIEKFGFGNRFILIDIHIPM